MHSCVAKAAEGVYMLAYTCVVQDNTDTYPVILTTLTWQTMGWYAHYTLILL